MNPDVTAFGFPTHLGLPQQSSNGYYCGHGWSPLFPEEKGEYSRVLFSRVKRGKNRIRFRSKRTVRNGPAE